MKKIISTLLALCLLLNPVLVNAETVNLEEAEIKANIENFFYSFEEMNSNADINQIMTDIFEISSFEEIQKYEMDNDMALKQVISQSADNRTYLEMVELLLQRTEIIEKTAEIDLTEYQKTLEISFGEIDIKGNKADVNVTVLKRWHYSFSPEIESAAEDYFVMSLVKEENVWKITNISGLSNVVMDEVLEEMGDEITKSEREGYITSIADEYSCDLKLSNGSDPDKDVVLYTVPFEDVSARATSGYNNTAAVNYALKYAITPNSSYTTYPKDCTNFTSQCLNAGGIKQHVGGALTETCWYYNSDANRSSSWTGANEFRKYVTSSVSKIDVSSSNWSSVVPGDMIQLMNTSGAYHSIIVTGLAYSSNGRSDLLVCAHTSNRSNVSLYQYYRTSDKVYYHINGSK